MLVRSKKKKERMVSFNMPTKMCILAYLEHERVAAKSPYEKLFLNHRNKPLTPRTVQRICIMFRTILHKKRIITPQILRSSYTADL